MMNQQKAQPIFVDKKVFLIKEIKQKIIKFKVFIIYDIFIITYI